MSVCGRVDKIHCLINDDDDDDDDVFTISSHSKLLCFASYLKNFIRNVDVLV